MAAPLRNRNAIKKDKRVQVGIRLNSNEQKALKQLFGGTTKGVQVLLAREIERRKDLRNTARNQLLNSVASKNYHRPIIEGNVNIKPFYEDQRIVLYHGDALEVLSTLPRKYVDCSVTSPPYYGQRDYLVENQLGLEPHPYEYLVRLLSIFVEFQKVLKDSGSSWVNIGDTYWSGRGFSQGIDNKQRNRRFHRPQDLTGERPWCTPKQLLLIPHRFAMLMQEHGWIVRNDNVWYKPDPIPDPVNDRCARVHEYVFHFVKQRKYYFDPDAVAVPTTSTTSQKGTKPHPSVWTISTSGAALGKEHIAVFPDALTQLPIRATCPKNGVFLDPFCGSGTSMLVARDVGKARRVIGIDADENALKEAQRLLTGSAMMKNSRR